MRTRIFVVLLSAVLLATASGCSSRSDADAERIAQSLTSLPHVIGATGSATSEFDSVLILDVTVDPEISDDDLKNLVADVDHRAESSGFPQNQVGFTVGENRSFSNLGGAPTLAVFLALRGSSDYTTVSARGTAPGVAGFQATVPSASPAELLAIVDRLVAVAKAAGGVQSNLQFVAATDDEAVTVSGEYSTSPAVAVAELERLAPVAPIDRAYALAIETGAQLLSLWVATPEQQSALEQAAATQSDVDVRVYLTDASAADAG